MILKELTALHFRNYESISIELPEEGALFHGINGSGKTSFLEAISFVLLGRSPRNASLRDMITHGEREAFVKGVFSQDGQDQVQSIGFSKEKELRISVDGNSGHSLKSLYGKNRFIYFGPSDIELITGTPEDKRRFVDVTLSQMFPDYLDAVIQYRKLLKERNKLLAYGNWDPVLIDVYDSQLSQKSALIIDYRSQYFRAVSGELSTIYSVISDGLSEISINYSPSIDDSADGILIALRERRERDREAGYTTIGPHRDSFKCTKDGRGIVGFGSQGECRSSALALKIATTSYMANDDSSLILAVDDAFSDLDRSRREKFYETIAGRGQLFIAVHSKEELQYYPMTPYTISSGKIFSI